MDTDALGSWIAPNAGVILEILAFVRLQTPVQVMQVAYGVATSTEVAYFTYIYAKISGEHYRLVRNSKMIWTA